MDHREQGSLPFRLATLPARVVGRWRDDLAWATRSDAVTYAGSRTWLFLILTVIAIAYPIIASVVHGTSGLNNSAEPITFAVSRSQRAYVGAISPQAYTGRTSTIAARRSSGVPQSV